MIKTEHDSRIAELRGAITHYEHPWYKSAAMVLRQKGIFGLHCLDLCAGNAEFSEILRDSFGMTVTCADYAPAHVKRQQDLGFNTLPVDLDAAAETVDSIARHYTDTFDLVVSLATIEHVFNSDSLLRFAHGVLRPEGLLLVNTPNMSFTGYRLYSCLSGNRPFGEGHHVRFWDYRFLRTNLFLNGFDVIDNGSRFYGVSPDLLTRAFKGRKRLASILASLFGICTALQHIPGGKNWFTDELTVLARKEDTYPIGFQYTHVKAGLERIRGQGAERQSRLRLQEALRRGWLREHPWLAGIASGD